MVYTVVCALLMPSNRGLISCTLLPTDIDGVGKIVNSPNLAVVSKTKSKARSEHGVNALRISRVALGESLTAVGSAALSPMATGCLVALVKFVCTQEPLEPHGAFISVKSAHALFAMKGLTCGDCELVLSALQMAGLTYTDGENVGIYSVDRALDDEVRALANYVAGWRKRANASVLSDTQPIVIEKVSAKVDSFDKKAVIDKAPAAATDEAPKKALSVIKKAAPASTRRFSAKQGSPTNPDSDPVMVRLICESGRIAEITEEYVEYLQSNFRQLDVLVQLKHAALWCESNEAKRKTFAGIRRFVASWLTRAASDADVRMAVVRVGNQKNGFGQGGDYAGMPVIAVEPRKDDPIKTVNDDFQDLFTADAETDLKQLNSTNPAQQDQPKPATQHFVARPFRARGVIVARAPAGSLHGGLRVSALPPMTQSGVMRQG